MSRLQDRAAPPLLAAMLAALALAGCGGATGIASKSAAAILATSRAAARNAPATRVLSEVFDPRADTKGPRRAISTLEMQLSGRWARARLNLLGGESEAIRADGSIYVKATPLFYERLAQRTGAHLRPGTWLKAPADGAQLAEFAALTEPGGELMLLLRDPTVSLTKGALTTINGRKAIELKTKGKLYTGAIYIAATGTPYPLMIVKHGRENSTTLFSGWKDPVTLRPPARAVELSQLEHHKAGYGHENAAGLLSGRDRRVA